VHVWHVNTSHTQLTPLAEMVANKKSKVPAAAAISLASLTLINDCAPNLAASRALSAEVEIHVV
jgi:hypothetical protein